MKGDLEAHFTFSNILEFVSRHYAGFSAGTKIRGNLELRFTFSKILEFVSRHYAAFSGGTKIGANFELRFTFSKILEFVKRAKKNASEGDLAEKIWDLSIEIDTAFKHSVPRI